eukprot:scaffold107053_cov17-Tisochrysis_lutea.AAC.1
MLNFNRSNLYDRAPPSLNSALTSASMLQGKGLGRHATFTGWWAAGHEQPFACEEPPIYAARVRGLLRDAQPRTVQALTFGPGRALLAGIPDFGRDVLVCMLQSPRARSKELIFQGSPRFQKFLASGLGMYHAAAPDASMLADRQAAAALIRDAQPKLLSSKSADPRVVLQHCT